ncbi:MAG: PKD domain-containing protein [Cyanothece sp. SIO1E1]|nr:PKD domain-containing protein [Cyanothece sp. SIO1E1]
MFAVRSLKLGLYLLAALLVAACSRPIANFTIQGETTAPSKISFENMSEKADSFYWDFGDGNTSSDSSPVHRYRTSGNYVVSLKAMKEGKTKGRVKEERLVIDAPTECLVEIETPFGDMLLRLYDDTPKHQENFQKLAQEGFFDSLLFHRVIDGFMIQGGDPNSRNARPGAGLGSGGPGYTIPAEFVDTLIHLKGRLAAARQGDRVNPRKNSSGSQFYIVHGRTFTDQELNRLEAQNGQRYSPDQREAYKTIGGAPFLDGNYTIFGEIVEGLDVIDKIAKVKKDGRDRPLEDVWMVVHFIN